MGFEEFLPKETEEEEQQQIPPLESKDSKIPSKIGQNQFYDVITSKKPDWQAIIYELINSEQLDPWNIDIIILTQKYFAKLEELEETDFYVSSRVLLAAALLLRIKSEFLLNKHVRNIDEILFGKKEENKQIIERIEIDEEELPILIPKTPLSRMRRVTLPELMSALNKAMNTESRRIKREVAVKRAHKLSHVDIPKFRRIDLKDRIKQIYARILTSLKKKAINEKKHMNKIGYTNLIGNEKEEKLAGFLPILHLDNAKKLWLEQETHLNEIWIYRYEYYNKNKKDFIEELEEDIDEMKEELKSASSESIDSESSNNPGLEKARKKLEEKKKLEEEIKKELEQELGSVIEEIKKEQEIEDTTGFSDEQ